MSEKKSGQAFPAINGMRGVACLSILCYHYFCVFIDDPGIGREALPFAPYSQIFFEYSKNAVELFFLLSGFLTAYHYREKAVSMGLWAYLKKHYERLVIPSIIVNLWALANACVSLSVLPGSEGYIFPVSPLRVILSILMLNTGWFTSYGQTGLPINSTMWFIDVLLLCYLLYYLVRRLAKNTYAYLCASTVMAMVGWICLEHCPSLPFLWSFDGRGYAPFFVGVLLCEFQMCAGEQVRKGVSAVWGTLVLGLLIIRLAIGFENVFGELGNSEYIRYFEFVAAPGILMCALNLDPVRRLLEWRPLLALGALSGALYYVHNNMMEDYRIVDSALGIHADFSSPWVFLLVVLSVIPVAILWQSIRKKLERRSN